MVVGRHRLSRPSGPGTHSRPARVFLVAFWVPLFDAEGHQFHRNVVNAHEVDGAVWQTVVDRVVDLDGGHGGCRAVERDGGAAVTVDG